MKQPLGVEHPKKRNPSIAAYLTLCLQPPTKIKMLMLCWSFHMFTKEQKQGRRTKQWTFCMDRDSSDCWKMLQKFFTIWEIYFKK